MSSSNVAAVQHVLDRYADAFRTIDLDILADLYADEVTVFDTMTPATQHGREAWLSILRSYADGMTEGVCTVGDVNIQATGEMAFISATIFYGDTTDGEVEGMTNRATFVLRPIDGNWKIVHEHTSVPLNDQMQPIV